jgi:hypothetical protein
MKTTIEFIPDSENDYWGALCVCLAMPDMDKPVMLKHYYPIFNRCRRDEYAAYIGEDAFSYAPGVYTVYLDACPIRFGLVNRGETLPILTVSEDIPAPKRAKEVRWYYGRWEKYTKSKGWEVVAQ